MIFFFFQAEDGIRDHCVTGVQTCALPIFLPHALSGNTVPVSRTTDCNAGLFQEPIYFAQRLEKIRMIPTIKAAQPRIGGKGQVTKDEQRSNSERYTARAPAVSGSGRETATSTE